MSRDEHLQNLLSAVTDALIAGDEDVEAIVEQYEVPRQDVDNLVRLVRRLHVTLVGQEPSKRFVRRLKQDLMGTPGWGVVTRVRRLPARVQIAAAIALVAGFMLLTRRRLVEDVRLEEQEILIESA
ncbi:MAG: hypothetical protein D6712_14990 [Chloroflexi bacterium]|nr:MAG: hypothetical protein D6712_14990 [Chloroflexota bacterium]